ncbi:MAG TPA: hypothetical protein VG672_06555, partial [Bryobacteraceae bacterium]|nr:hypothetical protein [Bryobacteraceae bacterium]
ENWLDQLARVLRDWTVDPLPMLRLTVQDTWLLAHSHYELEERTLFVAVQADLPDLIDKMQEQHAYAYELAAHLEALLDTPDLSVRQMHDLRRLAWQFHSIAQHNLLEEERELFPLADQLLTLGEQQALYRQLLEQHRPDGPFGFGPPGM